MWGFRFGMRRKRGLPHMIIYLLSTSPKNGVELMDGVESMTRGWWRPTPGSIYPLLKEMADDGIVKRLNDGRYELTPKGKSQAEGFIGPRTHAPRTTEDALNHIRGYLSFIEDTKATGRESMKPHLGIFDEIAKRISKLTEESEDQRN